MTDKIRFHSSEMSGFGADTSYEIGMQQMLWLGLQWIKDKPETVWNGTYSYKNIYGILHTGDGLKELEAIWDADPFLQEGGVTGAMHQAVMNHLRYIQKHGFENWLNEKGEPRDFEIPGDRKGAKP